MQIQENPHPRKTLGHLLVMTPVLFALMNVLFPHLLWQYQVIESSPLHSTVESTGAMAAMIMGLFIDQWMDRERAPWALFVALGFLSMGILDMFHAAMSEVHGFVLLHSLALLLGGAFFSLVWLPVSKKILNRGVTLKLWTIFISVGIGLAVISFRSRLPAMIVTGKFTPAAQALNIAGGLLFLIGSIRVYRNYLAGSHLECLLLTMVGVLSGLSGIIFQYSQVWSDGWWFWHGLRLSGYFLTLFFILYRFFLNIRESRAAFAHLEKKHQETLALFDGIDDVVYVSDPETHELLYVNDCFEKIWGKNVVGKKCYKVIHNLDTPCSFCTNDIIIKEKPGACHVWEFQNKVTAAWFRCADKAIQWRTGKPVRFAMASDITHQKANQQALEQEKYFSDTLIDSLPGVFYMFDQTGQFSRWNQNLESITGYSREELAGMTSFDLFKGQDLTEIQKRVEQVFESGSAMSEAFFTTRTGERIPFLFSGRLIEHAGSPYLMGVGVDITDRKAFEDELVKTNEELKRSNQALQQFAYVASHDLQEPLLMVSSYTQLIAERYRDRLDEKGEKFIHYAVDGAIRMQKLIQDLLTFSRINTHGNPFAEVDVNALIHEALENLTAATRDSGGEVTFDPLPTVMGDKTQLGQVLQNLIGNALKFKADTPPRIHISSKREQDVWQLSITDNGIGIDPQYADKIFIIFQRLHTREAYPGTGIGLALTKQIINRHGGDIWFDSEPGRGATFHFTLPAAKKES